MLSHYSYEVKPNENKEVNTLSCTVYDKEHNVYDSFLIDYDEEGYIAYTFDTMLKVRLRKAIEAELNDQLKAV